MTAEKEKAGAREVTTKKRATRTARSVTDAELIDALKNTMGIYAHAARWLLKKKGVKIDRSTISKRVKKSKKLQAAAAEVVENSLDFVEGKLFEAINNNNTAAIIFYLKCKGKDRGYVERQEVTGENGEAIETKNVVRVYLPDNHRE